ncbi:phosphoribosyltransferase [Zymomonas mobilis]|uniref:Phosphoribosyltransferase n=1 Tax=Zymomonas mobilis subsp. pomaceae (strain ATCC 29192 / DSM 22645 / JCM 10191 / CCUG 17912 / NBRC 13757 / NCIMB 11200 / NRRL B-4491 / Barker I) TaxID=579138 RepID=F8ERL8_ZYMMT|nr:phosphoribosyltransferase family protein [Zymomonas mobilis]AEI37476.1 phosphoribosyltransferase [Zymomonas mobilis subsp. pomaceae ATCC 29192]MDX5948844.1 phosphoribosyltransferase family protein [Zymomonas mobilis subsp. pomaceae]
MAQIEFTHINNEVFISDVKAVAEQVVQAGEQPHFVVGVGRGGLVPAVYLSHRLNVPMLSVDHSSKLFDFADELLLKLAKLTLDGHKLLFIDDINDSGGTILYLREAMNKNGAVNDNIRFAVLLDNIRSKARVDFTARNMDRNIDKSWLIFPWEGMGNQETIEKEANSIPERLA